MEISIFEVLGPVMIGPSSSHTAGAARLGRVAAEIAAKPFARVRFGLSGSFAQTCRGHGTDKALLAGVLGLAPDDEDIPNAQALARDKGVQAHYVQEDLSTLHENAVHITFFHPDGSETEVWGASIGGGRITITRIDGFETKFHAENPTILVHHLDRPGVISDVSRVLAENAINIGVLRLSRTSRGGTASAVFIVDHPVPATVVAQLEQLPNIEGVRVVDVS